VLTHLQIRNLAVIDEVELDLRSGFTVLTGETGAGKSMLVDALALAIGSRGDSTSIRPGAQRAEVLASFDITGRPDVAAWLRERDFDLASECQLRRVLTSEGRSRGYLNGQTVPIELLRDLGEQLVEICGQHAHQSLRQRPAQRSLLDAHGGHGALVAAMAEAHDAWRSADARLRALEGAGQDREARRELLEHQVRELQALNPQPGEPQALEQEHLLLTNRERIARGLIACLNSLYDAEQSAAQDDIGVSRREIGALLMLDPLLAPAAALLEQAQIQVIEAADLLRERLTALEHDPARQDQIETRLAAVQDLARKHRVPAEDLPARTHALAEELAALSGGESQLPGLRDTVAERRADMLAAASQLSAARRKAARSLAKAVTGQLAGLGMPSGQFTLKLDELPAEQIGPGGAEQVEFLVSTNPGHPPGPISRVASGGELSRLSLAIQLTAMTALGTPTLVFDEVDAGIGGGVAEIVGQSLKSLSHSRQVLCVTHLPQVASQADQHLVVNKVNAAGQTRTIIATLDAGSQVEEIARMLGGVKITERTRAHASEMLASARRRRAS
jgi:DNA repair protein RecN (Recombination protein N)